MSDVMLNANTLARQPMPMMAVNPLDHYWIIGDGSGGIYQSSTNTMVPADDTNYTAWTDAGGMVSPIGTEAELAVVLRQRGVPIPGWLLSLDNFIQPAPDTYDKPQLKGYSGWARYNKQVGGVVVNGIPFPTDTLTLSALNSAMLYTSDKQVNTFSWKLPDGTFITLDTNGIKNLQSTIAAFGQSCYVCEDNLVDSIDAGTVTDLSAIDDAYAAISNSFTGVTAIARR
jgi:hypothetical protein